MMELCDLCIYVLRAGTSQMRFSHIVSSLCFLCPSMLLLILRLLLKPLVIDGVLYFFFDITGDGAR
jgi:hypothetical protein